jgi:alkylation response protein AidB-like acyl-CoA dehydrogenase
VDFTLTDEQTMLAQSAARWSAEVRASGAHRRALDTATSPWETYWPALAKQGWLGIVTPGEYAGSDGTLVDACLLMFALHSELVPVPFATNAILVPAALSLLGGHVDLREQLALGDRRVSLGLSKDLTGPGNTWAWEHSPGAAVAVIGSGDVELLPSAESVGVGWDLLHPIGSVGAETAAARAAGWGALAPVVDVVSSAALVGLMDGALRTAVAYAGIREQFGQPIGAFQAIQHLCADMYVDLQAARAACLGAASAVDTFAADANYSAAVAKAWCAEASIRVTETAVQVLGGIGNTWESDAHLYLRGAHQWSRLGGGASAALDAVASTLFGQGRAA